MLLSIIDGIIQREKDNHIKENLINQQVKPRDNKLQRPSREAKPKSVANNVVQNAPKASLRTVNKSQAKKGVEDQSKKESKRAIGNRYGNSVKQNLEEKAAAEIVTREEVKQKPIMEIRKQNAHNLSQPSLHAIESIFSYSN